jgi:hypothetical protein
LHVKKIGARRNCASYESDIRRICFSPTLTRTLFTICLCRARCLSTHLSSKARWHTSTFMKLACKRTKGISRPRASTCTAKRCISQVSPLSSKNTTAFNCAALPSTGKHPSYSNHSAGEIIMLVAPCRKKSSAWEGLAAPRTFNVSAR